MVAASPKFRLPSSRDDLIFAAKLAEQAERYDEMVLCMKAVVKDNAKLSQDERNLLSVAYKNSVGIRRASWRILSSIEQREDQKQTGNAAKVKEYREMVEQELSEICEEIINLLEHDVLVHGGSDDRVFFKKMQGDYHRYHVEATMDSKHKQAALAAYTDALETAKSNLPVANPTRLGLVLNLSVFYYEILRNLDEGINLAKTNFDEAVQELENLPEAEYKEATLIMQLIRDNLTLWSEDEGGSVKDGTQ
ncbi:14-3-3 protein 2, partial [Diplonema papillatum]